MPLHQLRLPELPTERIPKGYQEYLKKLNLSLISENSLISKISISPIHDLSCISRAYQLIKHVKVLTNKRALINLRHILFIPL